ncbi:hypothetical protein L6452_03803 [Arctium lappa]|uniref:Uncharacterized protein n=1 Tax=Arctium lappa TaxID=4217 RepID=A0ACB9FMN1_ARCLA|nr:hypothetical protein L6452_03803 [Arctium lappa]
MAFTMSNTKTTPSSSPETQARSIDSVTTQLQLAHHHQSTTDLHKEAVLRRIRYHKCLRKLKGTFESLVNKSPSDAYEKWLEPNDAFTSP